MYSLIVPPHDDLRAAPHVDVVDGALVAVGQELRQRVPRLVQVVVGVEHRDVERAVRPWWVLRGSGWRSERRRRARRGSRGCGRIEASSSSRSSPIGHDADRQVGDAGVGEGAQALLDASTRCRRRGGRRRSRASPRSSRPGSSATPRPRTGSGWCGRRPTSTSSSPQTHTGMPATMRGAGRPAASAACGEVGDDVRRRWPARRPSRGSCRRCARRRAQHLRAEGGEQHRRGRDVGDVERVVDAEELVLDVDRARARRAPGRARRGRRAWWPAGRS